MGAPVRSRVILGVVVGLLVVTAGCAGGAQLGSGGGDSGGSGDGGQEPSQRGEMTPADDGNGPAQVRQRAVIRTGEIELQVDDFDTAQRNLTATVEQYGGFVSDSQLTVHRVDNESYRTGRLVLRVPSENFSAMMAQAQTEGEVESVTTSSEDVTDQLVDLDARLENLRAERARLRQLYRNASDTEDVLAVEERLSEVQGEIERLEAQKESLERKVALSTIRVELQEPRPESGPIDTDRWFDTPILVAFLESVNGVITSLRALVVAGAYGLPYAVVYGPLIIGAGYGIRQWRRRGNEGSPPDTTSDESMPDDATDGENKGANEDETRSDESPEPTDKSETGSASDSEDSIPNEEIEDTSESDR